MMKPTGAGPEQMAARLRSQLVTFGVPLLLMAAGCAPGDGPRPPVQTILGGRPGPSARLPATAGAGVAGPMSGVAGTVPPAGRDGITAGAGPVTAGSGSSGTSGSEPMRLPDGGLPPFDGGIEPTRNMVQAGQVCDRLTALQCGGEAHCCASPGRSYAQCRSETMNECAANLFVDDISKNSISGFSAAQAAVAFARLEEQAAACDPNAIFWWLEPDGFRGMFQGTIAPGQDCRPRGLVASKAAYGAALAACSQIQTHACLFTGDGLTPQSATCAPRADAGATCYVATNCKDGLYCNNPQEKFSSGKCTVAKTLGAPCTTGAECAKQVCKSGVCAEPTAQDAWCLK